MRGPLRNMVDLRNLLRQYGLMVYTGDRMGDLDLMESELDDLHRAGLLEREIFLQAKMLIHSEKRRMGNN
ncbi:hypothetical protein GCM10007416_30100 [Kroppenstedtia guangzhouensis]|uniref:DUF910 domain-containing protein n=1 Tax=Kroppenstedtia guangzhouensis TaxID=1274356 RepID=A0ABQ1H1S1_9BACL|nr:YqgQ family protein [Kroppenstedtia guangzhouensis]GGA54874.1 hypothetical protein GCM10007416_30100 [Kroppenstedtia guangzhouensis]